MTENQLKPIMPNTKWVSALSYEIKILLATDFSVNSADRHKYVKNELDDQKLLNQLFKFMSKEDRARSTVDLLLHLEEADFTRRIIEESTKTANWTKWMALATAILAFATVVLVCKTH